MNKFHHQRGGGGGRNKHFDKVERIDRNRSDRVVRFGDSVDGGGGRANLKFSLSNKSKAIQRKGRNPFYNNLDDGGDTIMDGASSSNFNRRGNNRGRGGRGGGQQNNDRNKPNHTFGPGWHKIILYNTAEISRDYILNALVQASRVPFCPYAYSVYNTNSVFYIDDRRAAESLSDCRINTIDQRRINLRVTMCGTPVTANIDEEISEKLKIVLSKRYNPTTYTLVLDNFCKSEELMLDYFLPLFRPSVVSKVFSLIEEVLPTLVSLDLSDNKLPALQTFAPILKTKTPNLRNLSLRKNRIKDIYTLEHLSGIKIEQIFLEDNPIFEKYEDNRDKLISDLRKCFPKILKLDGLDLPPIVTFEGVESENQIPDSRGSIFCNEDAKKIVLTFVEQYIKIYDTEDRQPLLNAYHEDALMSLASSYFHSNVSSINPVLKLSRYISESRNLIKLNDKSRKTKLLRRGKLEIVSFLNKLPKTSHDINSFIFDMPIAVDKFVLFSMNGIFKEKDTDTVRSFHRTFTVVPQNQGFVILNELFFITNPTPDQLKEAFKMSVPTAAPTPSTSPIHFNQQIQPNPATLTDEEKQSLVLKFSEQSKMNHLYSQKCLEDHGWNFQLSAQIFMQFHKEGKIPPEAFLK